MTAYAKTEAAGVIGPLGELLTLEGLPPASTSRWTPRRKAEVVAAVNGGLLSADEVQERYNLSLEELVTWQIAEERAGMAGLRVTHVQRYREQWERRR